MFLGVVVDTLITQKPLFLMMEYIGGGTLHQLLYSSSPSRTRRLSDERKQEILLDIARGLRYLHSQDPPVLHLDIKPANILMTKEGKAKLGDFGEAHVIQSSATLRQRQTRQIAGTQGIFGVGTLLYMAPEMHIEEEVKTPKVDMFSFGVLAAEVAGEKPPNPGSDRVREGGQFRFVPEPERRAADLAAIPSSSPLRLLVASLVLDDPSLRWNAQQALSYLSSRSGGR